MKALVVFDLDGTLAPSKSAIDAAMGAASAVAAKFAATETR